LDGDGDAGRSRLEGFLFRIEVVMDLFDLCRAGITLDQSDASAELHENKSPDVAYEADNGPTEAAG
jgi:hypothetical protein